MTRLPDAKLHWPKSIQRNPQDTSIRAGLHPPSKDSGKGEAVHDAREVGKQRRQSVQADLRLRERFDRSGGLSANLRSSSVERRTIVARPARLIRSIYLNRIMST